MKPAHFLLRSLMLALWLGLALIPAGTSLAMAGSGDRFITSAHDPFAGQGEELFTPTDFEAAAATHPNVNAQVLVSRCRFLPFSNTTSLYNPIGSPVADAIVGDTTFSFADGSHCYNPQNESNIVINPKNSNNVVTSANEYRLDGDEAYVSMDGGKTWVNIVMSGRTGVTGGKGLFAQMSSCGDPSLAFAPDGTLYYAGLACNFKTNGTVGSGVSVSASHDGGLTWSAPHMVSFTDPRQIFNDKEFITVGPDGTVYVSWTRFKATNGALAGFAGSPIVLSASKDGGNTWSDWMPVSDSTHPFNQGSFPLVSPDGTLYVAYEGSTPGSSYFADAIIVARSTNGGKTFTNQEVARAYDDYNCYPINQAQGRQTLSGEEFRINSFPSFAIDPTNGKLAITWADNQANASCGYEKGGSFIGPTSNQVKLITSTNGINWTSPQVITTGSADKVYPAVGANAGRIVVAYYTRAFSPVTNDCKSLLLDTATNTFSFGPGPVCLDFAVRSSSDNFVTETRLTSQSSNPYITFAGAFIGDYNGAAVSADGKALAVWADFRGNPGITNPNMDTDVARGQ